MKVKIGNKIYDSESKPIMLIFEDDTARKATADHLINMEDKEGIRKYIQFNNEKISTEEVGKFMKLE